MTLSQHQAEAMSVENTKALCELLGDNIAYCFYITMHEGAKGRVPGLSEQGQQLCAEWCPNIEEALVQLGVVDRYNEADYSKQGRVGPCIE